jgi:hypothetical protein
MSDIVVPEFVDTIESNATTALVSKGIYAMLYKMVKNGALFTPNVTKNYLFGYTIGGINGSGDTVSSEEYQDQLLGGTNKTFVPGAIDPGEITLTTYFDPQKGVPDVDPVRHSYIITPQFLLILAVLDSKATPKSLRPFWTGGVNYNGGNDLKGELGKVIGSSLKFKVTGKQKVGFRANGALTRIAMTDYQANS